MSKGKLIAFHRGRWVNRGLSKTIRRTQRGELRALPITIRRHVMVSFGRLFGEALNEIEAPLFDHTLLLGGGRLLGNGRQALKFARIHGKNSTLKGKCPTVKAAPNGSIISVLLGVGTLLDNSSPSAISILPSTVDDDGAVDRVVPYVTGQVNSPIGSHRPRMGFFGVPNRRRGFGADGTGPFEVRDVLGLAWLRRADPISRHEEVPLILGAVVEHSGRLIDGVLIGSAWLTKVLGVKLRHRPLT